MASEAGQPSAGGRIRRFALRYWVAIALAAAATIFILQNRTSIPINILWVKVTSPLWLLLTVIFSVGLVVGLLLRRRRS